jgi:hypothetical protein
MLERLSHMGEVARVVKNLNREIIPCHIGFLDRFLVNRCPHVVRELEIQVGSEYVET